MKVLDYRGDGVREFCECRDFSLRVWEMRATTLRGAVGREMD